MELSIVVPVYNEEKNIQLLYKKILSTVNTLGITFEIIFVDDGSRDRTFQEIHSICKQDKKVRCVRFPKNFKKSSAYMAGFSASKGKTIITLDGDLEHDPADIPKFLSKLRKYDLIIGWQKRKHQSVIKYIPSRIFNFLNNNIFNLKIHDADSGYRGMKSEVAKNFNLYGDLYRFIPALASQQGYRIGEVQTNYRKRLHGRSKYGGSRLITGAMDMLTVKFLTDFNQKPLHLFGLGGLIFFLLGFIIELFIVWDRVYRNQLFSTHMPLLILGILLMILGINLLGIGLVSELISSSQKTPRYRIKEVLNLNGF